MSNKQLTIHISRTSVHIAEVFSSNQEIVWQKDLAFSENSPERYKQKLGQFVNELPLQEEYEEYSLAWATPLNSLVPISVFNESSAKSIFSFLFEKIIEEKTIDFNLLAELNMACVYEIPDWVKSFFVLKFPRILFRHELAIALRALFQKGNYARKVFVLLNDAYVSILVVAKNELVFSNSFEYQSLEDILYYLVFVIEKEKIEDGGTLNFYYIQENEKTLISEIKSSLEKFQQFKNFTIGETNSGLKFQTLCV